MAFFKAKNLLIGLIWMLVIIAHSVCFINFSRSKESVSSPHLPAKALRVQIVQLSPQALPNPKETVAKHGEKALEKSSKSKSSSLKLKSVPLKMGREQSKSSPAMIKSIKQEAKPHRLKTLDKPKKQSMAPSKAPPLSSALAQQVTKSTAKPFSVPQIKSSNEQKKQLAQIQAQRQALDLLKEIGRKPPAAPRLIDQVKSPLSKDSPAFDNELLLGYEVELMALVKRQLHLPESAFAKVELSISSNGAYVKHAIITSSSATNQEYIDRELPQITLPPHPLKDEPIHSFTLNLYGN